MTDDLVTQSIAELRDFVRCRRYMVDAVQVVADRIEELEAKLAEAESRSEVLETLVMDVAADLYDGVAAHKIDQRIGDVMKKLNEEEEDQ